MTLMDKIAGRLANELTLIKSVKGAADLGSAKAASLRDTAFVLLIDEAAAGDSPLYGAVRQQITTGIGVVLAMTNRRDARGQAGMGEIERVRSEVCAALLGWPPTEDSSGLLYRRGRLLEINDATLWWQDEYETKKLISSEHDETRLQFNTPLIN